MVRSSEPIEQIRFAPVRMLRAVFSGVGQLLLAADRLREEDAEQAREAGDDAQDPLASWDGRLSSSVRLISPAGSPDAGLPASVKPTATSVPAAASTKVTPASAKPTPARKGRKAEPARASRASTSRGSTSRTAKSARADKSAKPASQPKKAATSAKRKPGDVQAAKATNASDSRKAGRSKATAPEPPRFRSLDLTGNVRMLSNTDIADMAADEFERNAPARTNSAAGLTSQIDAVDSVSAGSATPPWSQAAPAWSSWSTTADAPARQDPPAALADPAPALIDAPLRQDPAPARTDAPAALADPPPALVDAPPVFADSPPAAADLPVAGYDGLSLPSLRARLRNLDTGDLAALLAYERSHANRTDVVTMFERRIARLAEAARD